MKILLIHSDYIEFEPRQKAIKQAEDWKKEKTRIDECLVVFTAVEKQDEQNTKEAAKRLVDEAVSVANEVKVKKLVFYPYAHLSSELSSPAIALDVLRSTAELAKEKGFDVHRAPFGWYKAFTLKAKGHPLSELSRTISVGETKTKKKESAGKKAAAVASPPQKAKELSENDHRILGQKLDLYSFHEIAPGMAFFHPKGMIIRNNLMNFLREERGKRGYLEINTPLMMNKSLWETSGHWDHYKDNMFFTDIDDTEFAIKPMNCPGAILVFKSATRSYRELPLRLAEFGQVHRKEMSGVLSGMFRLRYFTQDDAHIFVAEEQLENEVERIIDFIDYFYKIFGFDYHTELSTRPDNAMGSKEIWDKAEAALESAMKKRGMKYKINPKDGAFYGPKIDFHIKDSLGRSWQCATVQVDFFMPERFGVSYTGEDNKPHRPVMVHNVMYGSIERFIGILTEHYKGAFPLWLSPVQVRVLPLSDKNAAAAAAVMEKLKEAGLRADADVRSSTVEYRVREAEMQKINYILVIGEKEEASNTIALRTRGKKGVEFSVKLEDFMKKANEEIVARRNHW